MAKFKLLAGKHVAADKTQRPRKLTGPGGEVIEKYPSKTYAKGQVVESDTDLAARFGPDKFQLVGGGSPDQDARIRELEAEVAQLRAQKSAAQGEVYGGLRTPGDPVPDVAATSPAVAPGGQVSTGFQCTSGGVTGAMTPEDAAKFSDRGAARAEGEGGLFADRAKGATEGEGKGTAKGVDLDSMTVEQLREHAGEEEINLHGAHTKHDIAAAIRKAKKAK